MTINSSNQESLLPLIDPKRLKFGFVRRNGATQPFLVDEYEQVKFFDPLALHKYIPADLIPIFRIGFLCGESAASSVATD